MDDEEPQSPPGEQAELRRLVGRLEEMTRRSGRSQRDIERELDLGNGYLSHLFKGRRELKVKHILMLGKVLGFDLLDFAQHAYADLPPDAGRPPKLDEERVRQIVRDELARLGAAGAAPPVAPPAV